MDNLWLIINSLAIVLIVGKIWYTFQSGKCTSKRQMTGKTIIITGASAGIGKDTAMDLAIRGAELIILGCRNVVKAEAVAVKMRNAAGNPNVIVKELDTSDLSSVRSFAEGVKKKITRLDILINNAGIGGAPTKQLTGDGLELIMATNHYGHFLLTNLLLGLMKSSGCDGRIINVSSIAHTFTKKLDPEDLNFDKTPYHSSKAYSLSKLCNILFTVELANKLKGTGITANVLHPGIVNTEIFKKSENLFMNVFGYLAAVFGKSSRSGAQTTIHLAVSNDVKDISGKYFVDCKETKPSLLAEHKDLAKKLWTASELDVKLEQNEIFY